MSISLWGPSKRSKRRNTAKGKSGGPDFPQFGRPCVASVDHSSTASDQDVHDHQQYEFAQKLVFDEQRIKKGESQLVHRIDTLPVRVSSNHGYLSKKHDNTH
jgi:hypothetical protein